MRRPLLAVLAFALGALSAACSSSSGSAQDASTDYFGVQTAPDAGGGNDGDDGGGGLSTTMRLAHLSPDVGPLDFCWRPSGSATFVGPVLHPALDAGAQDAGGHAGDASFDATLDAPAEGGEADAGVTDAPLDDALTADAQAGDDASDAATADAEAADTGAGDSGTSALDFGEMTQYVALPGAGTIDVALVAAGALSCGQPLLVQQVTLDAGKWSTVAVMGLAASDAGAADALAVVAFTDDPAPDPKNARVRLVHAALGWPVHGGSGGPGPGAATTGPLSVGASGPPPTPLAGELDPKHVSAMSAADPVVDGLGYATVPPLPRTQLTLEALGDGGPAHWQTADQDFGLGAGTMHTGFVVSGASGSLGIVWCGEAKTAGAPASCAQFAAR